MKKFNTSPISGMQELLPGLQSEFNRLKSGIQEAFALHGFQNIETPIIERTEILLAKAGGETEKQIYKVVKTAEAADSADQALRFDHTVPLARYVVEHTNDLTFPFKVSQVARNFRGERAQKGRFREFYQCDVDVIGWQKLPVAYDAEVIRTLIDALKVLPISKFVVRISNRKILNGLLESCNLEHLASEIFAIIDRAEKVPEEVTVKALEDLMVGSENVVKITTFSKIAGSRGEVISKLGELRVENSKFQEGISELDSVLEKLEGLADARFSVIADMVIVRGLDYYTGTVFETVAPEHREFGSVCSGGRYDNLAENYTDQQMPGVGGSIGLTRLFDAMLDKGLVESGNAKSVDICVVPVSENEIEAAEEVAGKLRRLGRSVDVVLTDKKFGDKMKYAGKVAAYAVIVGGDEVESGKYSIKNLESGESRELVLE